MLEMEDRAIGNSFTQADPNLDANMDLRFGFRFPPIGLLATTRVCKGWREMTMRWWREASGGTDERGNGEGGPRGDLR